MAVICWCIVSFVQGAAWGVWDDVGDDGDDTGSDADMSDTEAEAEAVAGGDSSEADERSAAAAAAATSAAADDTGTASAGGSDVDGESGEGVQQGEVKEEEDGVWDHHMEVPDDGEWVLITFTSS
jgi:hypothetical protein